MDIMSPELKNVNENIRGLGLQRIVDGRTFSFLVTDFVATGVPAQGVAGTKIRCYERRNFERVGSVGSAIPKGSFFLPRRKLYGELSGFGRPVPEASSGCLMGFPAGIQIIKMRGILHA